MAEAFDPYHKWLGIPPEDQPPNYYRLLGIKLFEADADVIANASDQRMVYIRALQTSEHADLSQKILNEISAARVCLLDADKKLQYNQELRERLQLKPKLPSSILPEQVRQEAKRASKSTPQGKANSRLTQCRQCRRTVSRRAELCPHCGAKNPAPLICLDCDVTISEHMETCQNCGAPNPNHLVPAVVVPERDIVDIALAELVDEETETGTILSGRESAAWHEVMSTTNGEQAAVPDRPGELGDIELDERASGALSVAGRIGALFGWLGTIDNTLRAMAGEENTILHNFLRCMAGFLPLAILAALIWMVAPSQMAPIGPDTPNGGRTVSEPQTAPTSKPSDQKASDTEKEVEPVVQSTHKAHPDWQTTLPGHDPGRPLRDLIDPPDAEPGAEADP